MTNIFIEHYRLVKHFIFGLIQISTLIKVLTKIYYKMREFTHLRRNNISKKQFYRNLAQIKKQEWASRHNLQYQDMYRSHFVKENEDVLSDDSKTKKIGRNQHRCEQRLRNRMAAQQSRERHRVYVEQLQRKVKDYEQLIEKQGLFCKSCNKNLLSQINHESEQHASTQLLTKEIPKSKQEHQIILTSSYLNDQMIRIDNNGASTPFGFFFIVGVVFILAIFSFENSDVKIQPRLLANYNSVLTQLIDIQQISHQYIKSMPKQSNHARIFQINKPNTKIIEMLNITQQFPRFIESGPFPNLTEQLRSPKSKHWTKIGNYICSQPEIVLDQNINTQQKTAPQFLLMRTQRNGLQDKKKKSILDKQDNINNYQIFPKQWQRVEISSCFLGQ